MLKTGVMASENVTLPLQEYYYNYILNYITIKDSECICISQYYCCYCILKQIYAASVSLKN